MNLRLRRAAAVALCLSMSGCDTTTGGYPMTTTASGYFIPGNIHYSEHWASTSAADLMSTDGTFIRAFVEANDVSRDNRGRSAGSYPGFAGADRTGNHYLGSGMSIRGYHTRWVVSLIEQGKNNAEAVVCTLGATHVGDGDGTPGLFSQAVRLRFHRVGPPPPSGQRGPERAPAVSVFSDWYATSYGPITAADGRFDDSACTPNEPPIEKGSVSTPGWPANTGR